MHPRLRYVLSDSISNRKKPGARLSSEQQVPRVTQRETTKATSNLSLRSPMRNYRRVLRDPTIRRNSKDPSPEFRLIKNPEPEPRDSWSSSRNRSIPLFNKTETFSKFPQPELF